MRYWIGTPVLWIHPIQCEKRSVKNSRTDRPILRASARTTLRVWPRSRIRNTMADARLPTMSRNAMTRTHFKMHSSERAARRMRAESAILSGVRFG